MYSNYNSLRENIQKEIENQKSVLNKFPENISRPITQSCSKHLAQFTSYQLPFKYDKQQQPQEISTNSFNNQNNSNNLVNNATNNTNNLNASTNISLNNNNSGGQSSVSNNSSNNAGSTNPNSASTSGNSNMSNENANNEKTINIIQLETVEQVNWTLENIMYGLTLSLEYQDIIKDCWNIYHDWLSVLLDEQKPFLPQVIKDDPINYSKKMLWHLYSLFIPRKESQTVKTNDLTKHIMMCHRVLMLIETIAKDSKLLKRDLWEDFLKFFLAINDAVLSPPFNKDDFGEILSSRIVATLFEIWLIACNKVFPSPALWKTFQEFCSNWRHHISLVIEWNRVCFALTNRLLELVWWPETTVFFNRNSNTNDTNVAYDIQTIINSMSTETVLQAWFRFFHIIGKPIDFCDINSISKSLRMQKDLDNSNQLNTTNFTCIKKLPVIFLESIKGVSHIVDSFLGIYLINYAVSNNTNQPNYSSPNSQKSNNQPTLEQKIRTSRISFINSSKTQCNLINNNYPKLNIYHANRPSVNSLLHLVGNWLFEAAIRYIPDTNKSTNNPPDLLQQGNTDPFSKVLPANREFCQGQAEAYGILCKIFCSIKTNEKILPEYLSRFYTLLLCGLRVPSNFGEMNANNEYESGEILASILVNGHNLFKLDLDGVNILHSPILNALNSVFKLKYLIKEETKGDTSKPKELLKSVFNIGSSSVNLVELKRCCIYIFSSLLSLSNHLNSLPVYDKELNVTSSSSNFFNMRTKILEIFLAAMTNEHDTLNLQILFGCGRLIVGEWSIDEMNRRNFEGINSSLTTMPSSESTVVDKKERVAYCFNQVVSLICAPLKINHATLQNHSFALSIFDSLASIAAGDILNEDESIFKIAISWIWHYVKMQIKRRSREHTKEMHSVIVAAYNCLITLLIKKPNLLRDKNCLQTVNNCIEIGISGSSSYPEQKLRDEAKDGSATLMKAEKELKPASLRVKEAAECVLCFIMENTSFQASLQCTNESNPELTRIPLNEKTLFELTSKTNQSKFKYFAIDGSLIIAIYEKPLFKSPTNTNNSPTLTLLLRGPFTCQAWSLHLRNRPFTKKASEHKESKASSENLQNSSISSSHHSSNSLDNQNATINSNTINKNRSSEQANYHDSTAQISISQPKCELSIPSLSDVANKCVKLNLNIFEQLKQDQIKFELVAQERVTQENKIKITSQNSTSNVIDDRIKNNTHEYQSARILLSHLGFCSLDAAASLRTSANKDDLPEVLSIDSTESSFFDQLNILDNLPTRTFSSCCIYYVKKNQSNAKAIMSNMNTETELDEGFYAFLQSLGSIIDVSATNTRDPAELSSTAINENAYKKLSKINGVENIFYWSDISSEIVFFLPNSKTSHVESNNEHACLDEKFKSKNQSMPGDIRVMIFWLEQIQDVDSVPIDDLLQESFSYENVTNQKPKELVVLFIHPLKSKMHRIITWNSLSKKLFYTMPLVDGMVVSSRMLSIMVRQTVLNVFKRKRLEIDDYQPPHVKRKNKITEIIKKFHSKKSEADYYTSLLMD